MALCCVYKLNTTLLHTMKNRKNKYMIIAFKNWYEEINTKGHHPTLHVLGLCQFSKGNFFPDLICFKLSPIWHFFCSNGQIFNVYTSSWLLKNSNSKLPSGKHSSCIQIISGSSLFTEITNLHRMFHGNSLQPRTFNSPIWVIELTDRWITEVVGMTRRLAFPTLAPDNTKSPRWFSIHAH